MQKTKWLSEEALQIAVKGSKGEKERYTHLHAEFQRIARRDKTAFLSNQCKEISQNTVNFKNTSLRRWGVCEATVTSLVQKL